MMKAYDMTAESKEQLRKGLSSLDSPNVFKFRNMNFVVGNGDKRKYLLKDVSGTVKGGRKSVALF